MTLFRVIDLAPFKHALENKFIERHADIVMVSRFSEQKDHVTLIQALHVLKQQGYAPKLHLAGGGGKRHRQKIEQLVTRSGLQDQVQFLGVHRDVPRLLKSHRICVLSSHWEGMPLALLEGMAAGCAVIGTDVPGIREVIDHGRTGLLVDESDPYKLAESIRFLIDEDDAAKQLGINAHHQAFREHSRERMNALYRQLLIDLSNSPVMASRNATAVP